MAKKKVTKKKAAKKKTGRKPLTQAQVIKELAEANEMTPKQVKAFFESMRTIMAKEINPKTRTAPGIFNIPGIAKVRVRKRPARKARKGVNPFTGEEMMFKAKPASNVVKIIPLKAVKELV